MLRFFISIQFTTALIFLIIWGTIALFFRWKTKEKAQEKKPAGLWSRFVCLGVDFALIDILCVIFAYHGKARIAGYLTALIGFLYFFFFWLFFSATPGKMIAGIKILPKEKDRPLKVISVLLRFLGYAFLFVGWIPLLFDKEKKRALHDFMASTRVVYSNEKIQPREKKIKRFLLILLIIAAVFAFSLIIYGRGEKITNYSDTEYVKVFDVNHDGISDGVLIDADENGAFEIIKYDLDNDRIIDVAFYDLDEDNISDALDINNDGRIDGYDFNGDLEIDKKVSSGYFHIWFWRIWFWFLGLAFLVLVVFIGLLEKKEC